MWCISREILLFFGDLTCTVLVHYVGECKLLARPLQFLMEYGDDPSKKSGLFIGFIQGQIAVPILSKKFQTEWNEVLNYVARIKVQNSIP